MAETTQREIDPKTFAAAIDQIVDQLHIQAGSRDTVNNIVAGLKSDYGLIPKRVRRAAKIIFDQNVDEVDDETKEVMKMLDLYNN